jgi:3'(2'), 5'-bisphosphate nucleotidase
MTDDQLAAELAGRAGELLLALRAEAGFAAADELRAAGDRRSHELLVAELGRDRPADAVLSEEGSDDRSRLDADRVWIVDPLDGTLEYGEEGRTDWAVHVALWQRGAGLTAGAVALPALGRTLSSGGELPSRGAPGSTPRFAVSRTRRPPWFDDMIGRLGAVAVPIGSAGMKAMSVVLGDTDAYVHSGRMKEWDSAAPVAVARAAGLHVSRLDGSELTYNTSGRLTPDLVICHPSLAEPVIDAVGHLANQDLAER